MSEFLGWLLALVLSVPAGAAAADAWAAEPAPVVRQVVDVDEPPAAPVVEPPVALVEPPIVERCADGTNAIPVGPSGALGCPGPAATPDGGFPEPEPWQIVPEGQLVDPSRDCDEEGCAAG